MKRKMTSRTGHMQDSDTSRFFNLDFSYLDAYRHAYDPIIIKGNLINTVGIKGAI